MENLSDSKDINSSASSIKQRWSESRTKSFILSYLSKNAVWDTQHPSYSQKTEKQSAYCELMDEFGLTMSEVKNKIRILRTTYSQERKKEQTIGNYIPKLSWYADMKAAFGGGKIKSFSKVVKKEQNEHRAIKKEDISDTDPLVHIEYDDDYEQEQEQEEPQKNEQSTDQTHMIIEPYEEEESYSSQYNSQTHNNNSSVKNQISSASSSHLSIASQKPEQSPLSSNELFLQSLRSTFDKLPDEKNMRARVKIQQILYEILYETP